MARAGHLFCLIRQSVVAVDVSDDELLTSACNVRRPNSTTKCANARTWRSSSHVNCCFPYTALPSSQATEEMSMTILYAQCNKNSYFVSDVWISPVGVVIQMRRRRWVRLPCGWHKASSTECTKQGVTTELEQETREHEKKEWLGMWDGHVWCMF